MLVKPNNTVSASIKVVGVGGAGNNAVNTMISDYKLEGVEFIAVNTDYQALKSSLAEHKLQIGPDLTKGLGAGGDPEIGAKAAEESVDDLHDALAGADMVFVTGGMGGGTGSGAIPVISGISQNMGALTVAVVTKPFDFEMKKRMDIALDAISKLKESVDTMIVIPNQKILEVIDKNLSFVDALKKADEILANAVLSIAGLVTQTGFINLDFADVRSVLRSAGTAMMGMGRASGENRAEQAARQAITSPLLEMSIEGAKGVLLNIRGGSTLTMHEVDTAASLISGMVDSNAVVKFGASLDEELGDEAVITVLAAGFPDTPIFDKPVETTPTASPVADFSIEPSTKKDDSEDEKKPKTPASLSSDKKVKALGDDTLDIPAFLRKDR